MSEPITYRNMAAKNAARYSDTALFGEGDQLNAPQDQLQVGDSSGTGMIDMIDTNQQGSFGGFMNAANSALNVHSTAENRATSANTSDALAQLGNIKSNEQWQSAVDSGQFSDEQLKATYGRNINIDQLRKAQEGKKDSTNKYSFTEGMRSISQEIGELSSSDALARIAQLGRKYDQDTTAPIASFAATQAAGRANLSDDQKANVANNVAEAGNHMGLFTTEANKTYNDELRLKGIDIDGINSFKYKEGDENKIGDYILSKTKKDLAELHGIAEGIQKIERETGQALSYKDFSTAVEATEGFWFITDDTVKFGKGAVDGIITRMKERKRKTSLYDTKTAKLQETIRSEQSRVDRKVGAYAKTVGKNALYNTYNDDRALAAFGGFGKKEAVAKLKDKPKPKPDPTETVDTSPNGEAIEAPSNTLLRDPAKRNQFEFDTSNASLSRDPADRNINRELQDLGKGGFRQLKEAVNQAPESTYNFNNGKQLVSNAPALEVRKGGNKKYGLLPHEFNDLSSKEQKELKRVNDLKNERIAKSNNKLNTATKAADREINSFMAKDRKDSNIKDRQSSFLVKAAYYAKKGIPNNVNMPNLANKDVALFINEFSRVSGKTLNTVERTTIRSKLSKFLKDGSGSKEDTAIFKRVLEKAVAK